MLSAIAVRRARGLDTVQQDPLDPSPSTPSPPLLRQDMPPSTLASKRKPKSQGGNSSRKRKKEIKDVEEKRTRYFDVQDAFEREEDLVVIDQDGDGDDSDSDEEIYQPEHVLPPKTAGSKKITERRAWSPSVPLNDSSDQGSEQGEEGPDILEDLVITTRTVSDPEHVALSTFQPVIDQNTFHLSPAEARSLEFLRNSESITILALAPAETITLLGTYALTIVYGSISLSGVGLNASSTSHRVFAPRSSPVPVLRCLSAGSGTVPDPSTLTERLRNLFAREVAVIALQETRTGVEGLGRVCRTFNGVFEPSRWQRSNGEPQLGLSSIHVLTHQSKDIQPFFLPATWETALSSVASPQDQDIIDLRPMVCFVKGPKKTGKSTFARTLLNRLLTRYQRVAFLECDLGQSEFTPGGMVALNIIEHPMFGPPFTHPTLPNFAHYVGATSPRSSPSHYLAAVQSLLQTYRLDIQLPMDSDLREDDRISNAIPLVVNTMGWTKGLGADLSRQIEEMVEPTHIYELEAPIFKPGWAVPPPVAHPFQDHMVRHAKKVNYSRLEPIPSSILSTNYSPADHRNLSILSYFHAIFPSTAFSIEPQQVTASSWNTTLPLCAQSPYEVNWSSACEKFILTGPGAEDVVSSEIEHVLNCAIVGLVSCEPGTIDVDIDSSSPKSTRTMPYVQGSPAPSPSSSNCHGIALIRALSPTSSHMHVLTPLPSRLIEKCKVLIKGELELPIWGMLDFGSQGDDVSNSVAGVEKGKVPYLQWGKGEGIGGERRRVRRNLMRRGQM